MTEGAPAVCLLSTPGPESPLTLAPTPSFTMTYLSAFVTRHSNVPHAPLSFHPEF